MFLSSNCCECPLPPLPLRVMCVCVVVVVSNLLSSIVLPICTCVCDYPLGMNSLPAATCSRITLPPSLSSHQLPGPPLVGVEPQGPFPCVLEFGLVSSCAGYPSCCERMSPQLCHTQKSALRYTALLLTLAPNMGSNPASKKFPEPWMVERTIWRTIHS